MLHALTALARLCKTITEDNFKQNLVVRSLLGPSLKLRQLAVKKDAVPTISNVTIECCKPAIGQKTTKTSQRKKNNNNKNNACRTVGELLGHFPSKIRFVFRSKNFPMKDSLTQKCSNVQDNNDITKQSLSSIPSIKVGSHFGNVFVKPSPVFVLLMFLLLFTVQKEKFPHKFPFTCFLLTFRRYKMAEEKMSKFWFI